MGSSETLDRLRFGIVGTGIMARTHAAAIRAHPQASVTAWATRNPSGADATLLGDARVHGDAGSLARDTAVDAVLVATPDFAHLEASLAALEAGKHLLVEKPLATSSADAHAILDAARDAGVTAMALFNHRWIPAYWQARERSRDGALGEPLLAYARKNNPITVPTEMISWADRSTPAWFLTSHDLDLVLWYFGTRPVEVFATAVSKVLRRHGIDTPDAIQAQLRFENGALGTFEACWTYPAGAPAMPDSFMELIFTDGVVHIDRKIEQLEIVSGDGVSYPRNLVVNTVGGKPSGAASAAVGHFVECVLEGRAPLVTLESSVLVSDVLEAVDRSWREGVAVPVSSP